MSKKSQSGDVKTEDVETVDTTEETGGVRLDVGAAVPEGQGEAGSIDEVTEETKDPVPTDDASVAKSFIEDVQAAANQGLLDDSRTDAEKAGVDSEKTETEAEKTVTKADEDKGLAKLHTYLEAIETGSLEAVEKVIGVFYDVAKPKPNLAFIGYRQNVGKEGAKLGDPGFVPRQPIPFFNDGMDLIELPDANDQSVPFYHPEAARIVAICPELYKPVI